MARSYGLYNSQRVMLALAGKGLSREEAYALVQKNAMKSWSRRRDFKKLLLSDKDIMKHLTRREINNIFNPDCYLENIEYIFRRVFGKGRP